LNKYVFTCLLYSVGESVSQSDSGRMFHSRGAVTEKARCPPSLVCIRTVMAAEIFSVKVDVELDRGDM